MISVTIPITFEEMAMSSQLICYHIRIRDIDEGYWKDFSKIFPESEVVKERVRWRIFFWKWRVVKKLETKSMAEDAARVKAIRIVRRLFVDQDTRLYEVVRYNNERCEYSYKIWENGKFTNLLPGKFI